MRNFNLQNDGGSSYEKKLFNIFTRVWIFIIFEKKCVVSVPPAMWCKVIFKRNEFATIKIEASFFKMRPSGLLYDLFLQLYQFKLFKSEFFIVITFNTIMLFMSTCWKKKRFYLLAEPIN